MMAAIVCSLFSYLASLGCRDETLGRGIIAKIDCFSADPILSEGLSIEAPGHPLARIYKEF
jgi:hypothetical protein